MAYPGQFHRLVMIGDLYSEKFNMTLSIVPSALGELGMPAVDTATLAAVAGDVGTWFAKNNSGPGPGFTAGAKLTSLKLNRIGPNGKYVDPVTREYLYPTPVSGVGAQSPAPQTSLVVTFGTRIPRGRGSKGRVYGIPNDYCASVSTVDGLIGSAQATSLANGWLALITALNTRYSLIGRVGVASDVGTGVFEHVTKVGVGRVIDTMRSRRNTLNDAKTYVTVP